MRSGTGNDATKSTFLSNELAPKVMHIHGIPRYGYASSVPRYFQLKISSKYTLKSLTKLQNSSKNVTNTRNL